MDIRRRLYPYPVLSDFTDDYINSSFGMEVLVEKGIREINFNVSLKLVNDEMQQMINEGTMEYVVHIECPQTCYRTIIKTNIPEIKKNIPESRVNGRITVCSFIVAKKDIQNFSSNFFNEDYSGISFTLHKGNIAAIGGQVNIDIIKDTEELSKVPSIFTICRSAEDTDEHMKIDINNDKITIILCSKSFSEYKILSAMPSMLPVLHSILIVPTLIYVFETLKKDGFNDFKELRWFRSVERTLKKNGFILNEELLNSNPSYELAQKTLDMPINRAFDSLITQDADYEEEE